MRQRKIGMLKVMVVLLQILIGANLAGAAGIGFGFEGSKTYLIQNTGVTLLSSIHQFDAVFGAGNGIAYGKAGNALCKIDSSGVSLVGPSSMWGGITQYAGAGNGKAYVMVGNVVYWVDGTSYVQITTTWSSAARLVGAGNGTAFILEGDGSLWKLNGYTYSSCPANWAGTTTFFSAGKEEAFLKQGANVYRAHAGGYWTVGGFNDATRYASGGIGIGYALENNKLYRLPASSGGYQSLTGTWSSTLTPTWMVGLGNGSLYLIDENANLYFIAASETTAQQFSYSWTPTLFEGLGDGDAVYMQNGNLFYLTGFSYASIGSGTYNFTKIVGAMDIDSGTVAAYTPINASINVPASSTIEIDGDVSEWSTASQWSTPFVWWNGTGLTSTTRAKFAYNDAQDILYVAIETDEASLPGGHAVVGFGTSLNQTAYLGDGATQLAFETFAGGNSVKIVNEIHKSKELWPDQTSSYVDSGIKDVQAAYSYNGSKWTYEIAIPMWTNWAIGQMTTKTNLIPGNTIYAYAMMQDELASANGTNMTYYGNPGFANPGGLANAAKLTLMPRAACTGPMLVDPVVYYNFDDITNIGKDSSGHGYDATVAQYPVTDSSNRITGAEKGYFGGAANFPMPAINPVDSTYTYHNALTLPAINAADIPTSGFSVAAWVNLDSSSIGEHYQLFAAEAGDGNGVVSAYIRVPGPNEKDNTYRLILSGTGGTTIKDLYLGPITQDQWVHYVGTYDQATNRVSIYINGQLLISDLADTTNLTLADNWNNGAKIGTTMSWGRQFVGQMDEFYLFKRALAPVEAKILSGAEVIPGDANGDGLVDVGDLGILAANYGGSGKTWPLGDFNKDGLVDVGDLGILAAHYGQGSAQALNFSDDYAKAFGTTAGVDDTEEQTLGSSMCGGLGLPLIGALALLGLMLVKLED